MHRILQSLKDIPLRAYVSLQVFAAQEPVRLRAALTSVALMGALFVPALANDAVAEKVGVVGAVVLPILVGESTRKRVTPADE
ncbi:hypothetical protein ACFQ8W_00410 [Streptomyces sp. NPDC056508]|uniref:hypothetical protein n=1 Tax=Streptomyces sp. NPDC056508 TaxID=3345845 RepID=UPI0036BEC827